MLEARLPQDTSRTLRDIGHDLPYGVRRCIAFPDEMRWQLEIEPAAFEQVRSVGHSAQPFPGSLPRFDRPSIDPELMLRMLIVGWKGEQDETSATSADDRLRLDNHQAIQISAVSRPSGFRLTTVPLALPRTRKNS
jgi:hypothetical protein